MIEKIYKIKSDTDEEHLLTEKQMRTIYNLRNRRTGHVIGLIEPVTIKLKAIASERMMKNLLAKAVYEHSEEYNKEITSHYAKISEFVHNYYTVKFKRIHRRRYKIYSKTPIRWDVLVAYKRVLARQWDILLNPGLHSNEDIIVREYHVGLSKFEYEIQIIKNCKKEWIDKLR